MSAFRILIVEDHVLNRDLLQQLLEDDYDLDFAVDGFQGLQKALAQSYSLILLDLTLPKMDGLKVASLLTSKRPDAPPLVAVTGHAFDETETALHRAGFCDYVAKPIEEDQLRAVIERHLGCCG